MSCTLQKYSANEGLFCLIHFLALALETRFKIIVYIVSVGIVERMDEGQEPKMSLGLEPVSFTLSAL